MRREDSTMFRRLLRPNLVEPNGKLMPFSVVGKISYGALEVLGLGSVPAMAHREKVDEERGRRGKRRAGKHILGD